MERKRRKPTLWFSIITLTVIVLFIALGFALLKIDFSVLLFLSWLVAGGFAMCLGYSFMDVEQFAYESAKRCIGGASIILAVGIMIAAFMASGTVPTILVIGLKLITPRFFLLITFLLCCITSMATGTSWGTAGTVGVAMIGVGAGLGINPGITAGAIVSGSYFGDKMSPVSDTTILASTLTDTDIWDHIKQMCWTTIPAAIICSVIYIVVGMTSVTGSYNPENANEIVAALSEVFKIDAWTLIPLAVIITLIVMRKSTVGSLLFGSVIAGAIAVIHQGYTVTEVGGFLYGGFVANSDNEFITGIINRGGMMTLISLVAIFISALGLGGILTETGILTPIFEAIVGKIKSGKGVLLAAYAVTWISIILVPTYNFPFVMGATLFKPLLDRYGLKSENLSRILEDCGTLGGTLLPWSTGPVFMAGVLGVPSTVFCKYVFLSIFVPLLSLVYILTGFTIKKTGPKLGADTAALAEN